MSQRYPNSTRVCHWLIHHAARQAPPQFAHRLEEEWLADLTERASAASRLRFALGCCWARRVIAREHHSAVGVAAVTAPVMQGKFSIGYAPGGFGNFSRRSSTLGLVVAVHAAVFYILLSTVLHVKNVNHDPLQNLPIDRTRPADPPRIPTPDLPTTHVFTDPRLRDLPIPQDPDRIIDTTTIPEPTPAGPPADATPHIVKQVAGGPGTGFPDPDDFYPVVARHLEEQGIATVQVCVDAKGRLTSAPTTLQGSGSVRLDEGALKLAKAGSGHYRAATQDGHPVDSCFPFRVRFQLKN
jgi:TonB family protein